jgi:hypothetical protein
VFDRLSAHTLRVGFITQAYEKRVRDEDTMRHTRHRNLRLCATTSGALVW